MEVRESIALALRRQGSGDWAAAAQILSAALDRRPSDPDLLFHLGIVRRQQGSATAALDLLKRARAAAPRRAEIHYVLGNCHMALDRLEDAAASYRQALTVNPKFPDAYNNLGFALGRLGRLEEAIAAYRRALAMKPDLAGAHHNLAIALARSGRPAEAIGHYRTVLAAGPAGAAVHFELATALAALEQWEEACAEYDRALAIEPGHALAYHDRGVAQQTLGQLEAATVSYRHAAAIAPDNATFLADLGHALVVANEPEAVPALLRALSLEPGHVRAHLLLSQVQLQEGQLDAAAEIASAAAARAPEDAELRFNAGLIEVRRGRVEAAIAAFRQALALNPAHEGAQNELLLLLEQTLDWEAAEALAPTVRAATDAALAAGRAGVEKPFENLARDSAPRRNREVAEAHARRHAVPPLPNLPHPDSAPTNPASASLVAPGQATRVLHLGYLSADFHDHPVAQLIAPVMERHDRRRFTVSAYSYNHDDGSAWRRRIASGADRFVELRGLGDRVAARRIRDDGIDILIDLTVWTANTRIRIPMHRPAPLQLQYLGFPGTSGSLAYDYAIVDGIVVPPEQRDCWSERLILMPQCYMVVDGGQATSRTGLTRAVCGLPDDGVVFCSFNQGFKIDRTIVTAWLRLLVALPGSVLWLSQPGTPAAAERLRAAAAASGVAPERLVFAPRLAEKAQHMERLALADLALDTITYNGHTTTADALLAGVPVVALRGRHFASRVSASMLSAVGLAQLVVDDLEGYLALALRLGRDAAERARLRSDLVASRPTAPLFDLARGVAALERGFELAWRHFAAGSLPPEIRL